jgi:hypothetical protein
VVQYWVVTRWFHKPYIDIALPNNSTAPNNIQFMVAARVENGPTFWAPSISHLDQHGQFRLQPDWHRTLDN